MPRSIWKGTISFGMISVPVKLYAATESKDVAFNTLHATCNSRIRQKRWCPTCDREVEQEELVRGYQYEKDNYVVLTEEELEKLPVASKHTIDLTGFVKSDEIDPVHYERSYFVEPEPAGLKPYALLMRALDEKDVVAVAKIALRQRESLCVIRPLDGALMLDKLYYPDEVRTKDKPSVPDVLVSKQELNMAYSLIDLLQEPFEPEKYDDAYRSAVLDLIEAKKKGKKVVSAAPSTAKEPTDLMAALKATLEAAQKGKRPPTAAQDDDAEEAASPKKASKRKAPAKPTAEARKLRKAS